MIKKYRWNEKHGKNMRSYYHSWESLATTWNLNSFLGCVAVCGSKSPLVQLKIFQLELSKLSGHPPGKVLCMVTYPNSSC